MRPSTLLRRERLNLLVVELSLHDLRHVDIAALLECSASSARNYIFELMDGGVITVSPNQQSHRSIDRTYRLCGVERLTDKYQEGLTGLRNGDSTRTIVRKDQEPVCGCCDFRVVSVSNRQGRNVGAKRDPLVAALFGSLDLQKSPRV